MQLDTSAQYLNGVGPVMAKKLERLGIETVRDLLFYFPRDWDDFSKPKSIAHLFVGEKAIIKAKVMQIKASRTFHRRMSIVEAILVDDSGQIKALWFNQPFLAKVLKPGDEWIFSGKVNFEYKTKLKILAVSQYEKDPIILAVYPETEGLTSKYLRRILRPILEEPITVEDYLPAAIIKKEDLIDLSDAIRKIHSPKKSAEVMVAKKRLAFDELFLFSLRMLERKKELSLERSFKMKIDEELLKTFVKKLPFQLTNAQRRSAWEIIKDLCRDFPMNRLLEGDVGSGKTIVAAMAVLVAGQNNYQVAWLAPTEILAQQHYRNISKIFQNYPFKIGLLTASSKKADLEKNNLIIGTHALIQNDISIPRLALLIIDEQHRFGVKQRAYLRSCPKKQIPHLLSMTATPIPRTLALAFYGDLDLSIINEMPPGRQKIITKVIDPKDRLKAYEFVRRQVQSGRQVFVVCPLIEEAQTDKLFDLDRKSAIAEYAKLSKDSFPDLKVALLHGKMKSKDKESVMREFAKGNTDILVSTAVIEVGIDVSNATVMMIEGADRFGLAQLHQFRGRVGRGKHQSYCLLFSEIWSEKIKKRLGAMEAYDDGFKLAEIDLNLRGPGELIGTKQSGLPDLKMASFSDIILIKQARNLAEKILDEGIQKYPKLVKKLNESRVSNYLD